MGVRNKKCKTKEMLVTNYVCSVTESLCVTECYVCVCACLCMLVLVCKRAMPCQRKNGLAQAALMSLLPWLLLTQCVRGIVAM